MWKNNATTIPLGKRGNEKVVLIGVKGLEKGVRFG